MTIKTITKQDLGEIDLVQRLGFPKNMHEDMSLFVKIIEQKNAIGYVLYNNSQISGYILGYPTDKNRENFQSGPEQCENIDMMYLHDLCVHPDFQGLGIGQKLFQHFQKHAEKKGCVGMIAMAIEGRLSFWERLGFEAIIESDYHGTKSTRVEKYFHPMIQDP